MPSTKPLVSGDVGEDVVGEEDVGRLAPGPSQLASSVVKNVVRVRMPPPRGAFAGPRRGSIPSTGTPRVAEMTQHVAVVARRLDHQALGPEPPRREQIARRSPGSGP